MAQLRNTIALSKSIKSKFLINIKENRKNFSSSDQTFLQWNLQNKSPFKYLCANYTQNFNLFKRSIHIDRPCLYSSLKSTKQTLGLADELLSAKVSAQESSTQEEKVENEDKKKEDKEKTLRTIKFSFYSMGFLVITAGGLMLYSWGSPPTDKYGQIIPDEFSRLPLFKQYLHRAYHEAKDMNKMIIEPSSEKLLPDPVKEPYYQPPYTLVLEMKDILVHPEWTYETGWRFKKRPGVDFLLQHCGPPLFEVVIYTNEQAFTAFPVIEQLDPNGFVWYKLFKDSTRYQDGKHLKDLDCLNRNLSNVIVVDWDSQAITYRRNQLTLSRWDGNMNDQTLVDLAMMLRTIAESGVSDVREVLDYYRSFDDPIAAFRANQQEALAREAELKKIAEQKQKNKGPVASWASSFLNK